MHETKRIFAPSERQSLVQRLGHCRPTSAFSCLPLARLKSSQQSNPNHAQLAVATTPSHSLLRLLAVLLDHDPNAHKHELSATILHIRDREQIGHSQPLHNLLDLDLQPSYAINENAYFAHPRRALLLQQRCWVGRRLARTSVRMVNAV